MDTPRQTQRLLVTCTVIAGALAIFTYWKHQQQQLTATNQRQQIPTVTITRDGKMYLAGKQVSVSELVAILTASADRTQIAPGPSR